jgi:uncharacterized membrane protein YgcG
MEVNPYESNSYNRSPSRIPQQNQADAGRYTTAARSQQPNAHTLSGQRLQQRTTGQKPKSPARMPKAQALALVRTLKKSLVIASIVGFGAISGLAAYHRVGTTTTTATRTSSTTSSTSEDSHSNAFFKQQEGDNLGSSSSSQSSNTGSSNGTSSSSSAPVSGSSVS